MALQKIKLFIAAGEASSAPPTGPILGQVQINISDFVPKFNSQSAHFEKGIPIATVVRRNPKDKSYTITMKGPTTMSLLDNVTQIAESGKEVVPLAALFDILRIRVKLSAAVGIALSPQAVGKSLFSTLLSAKIGLHMDESRADELLED